MDLEGLPPVGGLVESSLTLWEGRVAAGIYLQGCNLSCPACPVPHLVPRVPPREKGAPAAARGAIPAESVLDALFRRRALLDGVVVAGGEPLLHPNLPDLLEIVRSFGLATRVRTNGTRPRALARLLETELVDSVSLVLRAPLTPLAFIAAGREIDLGGLWNSVELVMGQPGDHEFRISADPRLLGPEEAIRIGRTVAGARRVVVEDAEPQCPSRRYLHVIARRIGRFVDHCTVAGEPGRDHGLRGGSTPRRTAKGAA